MGSSCSSIRKKERQRSRRSSSDVGNPLEICGQRRCSERSADSLPYGAKASPPSVTRSHPPPVGASTGEPSNGSQSGQSAAIQTTSQAAKEKNHLKVEPTISQPTSPKPSPTNKSQESVIPHLSHYNEIVKGLLMGQIQKIASVDVKNLDLVSPKEIVIVLLSPVGKPSFLDNVVEKLKSTCAKKGYDLTLLNFDFGVEPFCLNDHNYRNLCFDTLTSFRTSKQKVLHLVILATSDGLIPLPTSIEKKDFENLLEDFDAPSKEIFRKWYKLDESGKVDLFLLKKVGEVIKGFTSGDKNEEKDAIESWRKEYTVMVDALKSTTNDKLKTKYALPLFEDAIKHIVEGPQALQKQTFLVQLEVGEVLDGYSEAKITLDKLLPDSHKVYAASKDTQEINEDALRILNSNLQKMLEAMMDEESQEESLQLFTGLDYGIHVELLEQELARRRFASNQLNLESTLRLVSSYINSTTDHPLVVFGEMGSGRSSLAAKACLRFSSLFDAVLYRFVDVSEESRKHQQLLRSICEQMCFILGKHPSVASIVLNDDQEIIGNLFELTSEKPILIIVDGIDIAASQDTDALTWLTKKLPSTVKVIVTTTDNSRCLVYLKEHLTANAFARIQNPTSRELIDLIETQLRDHEKKLDDAQKEHVQNFLQKLPSPLYAHLLAMFILKFGIDDFTKIPENVDCLLAEAITLLKSSIGSTVVECAIAILTMLKHGITEGQVIDLMSSDQEVIDSVSNYGNTSSNIFPSWAWLCLKDKMSIFWTKRLVGRKQVIAWRSHYFSSAAKRLSLEETLKSFSKKILVYIRGRPLIYVSSQVDKLSNRCKTEEIPFLNLSIDATTFKEKFIFNTEWLLFKVKTSDPFSLLEDINAYQLCCGDNDAEIHFFDRLIRKCAYPLRYDGSQILSQLFGRLHLQLTESKSEELASYTNIKCLYDASCQPDVASLLPLNTHFMANDIPSSFESLWYSNETYEKSSTLYTIKGEAAHVISLSSDAGEIVVWNVHEQKPVRILKGINQPRDLKMIDKHRAIVLCNRELVVYNLNDGVMESKLKGVMNQKMPFFGLHDENYAVALSRNRMYVNMINLVTGDLETQFKVGEDRFLNSLLVSANGKICVCGDETQKPFPLLVWDLSNRKLLYDLRIPHHEFITRLAAISDDGHYVVSVCKELNTPSPNFIIVYDLQSGTLFKKWKPESNTRSIAISSQGGYVMNGIDNCRILVWDLSTGAKKYTLFGHVAPVDVLQVSKSGKILMSIDTTCMDRSIRLWDLDTGVCLTVFTPDRSLSCCQLLPEGNIVVFSFKGAIKLNTLFLCHQNSIESHKIADQQSYGNPENDGLELNLSAS